MKSLKNNDSNADKNLKTINGKPTDEKELARVIFQYNEHNHNDSAVPSSIYSSIDHVYSHYSPSNHSDEVLTETPLKIKYILQITCKNYPVKINWRLFDRFFYK